MSSPDAPQFNPPPSDTEPQPSASIAADSFPPPTFAPEAPAPKSAESPVWTGWDVLQIAFLTIVTLIFLQLVLILSANRFVYSGVKGGELTQALVEGKYHVGFWQAIRWKWPGGAAVKRLGLGVMMVGLDLLGRFLPMPRSVPFDQFFARPTDAYLTTAFAVTLGPLMEELFFRGFLYPVLARRMGVVLGVIFTALPFGLLHLVQYGYAWGAVLVIFLVGVVLTAIRAVTGSVAASFLAHVGYNATLMMLTAAATGGFRHMDRLGLWLAYR